MLNASSTKEQRDGFMVVLKIRAAPDELMGSFFSFPGTWAHECLIPEPGSAG